MVRTLVFDIDDTICVHKNRDYPNAEPIQATIDKINRLKQQGYRIKLYTARGQNSCNGDLALIQQRNEAVLTDWLDRHGVQYDELIFGKPLGDWYIDDKAMSLDTFLQAPFKTLKGGSGSGVYLEDRTVIKHSSKAKSEREWYRRAETTGIIHTPRIHSITLDTLYMEYIDGAALADCLSKRTLRQLVETVYRIAHIPDAASDLQKYTQNLFTHDAGKNTIAIAKELERLADEISSRVSFSHGDLALSNVINRRGTLYFIDPNYKGDFSSYILDLAKIRFSLTGYEFKFGFSDANLIGFREYFDTKLVRKKGDLQLVKLFEITHWIRIYKYRTAQQREQVETIIAGLLSEYRREYGGSHD